MVINERQAQYAIATIRRATTVLNHFTATDGKWGLALI